MARQNRVAVGDVVYHVINRSNGRVKIFSSDKEYQHFESLLLEGVRFLDMRILAYVIMSNHWHLVLYPKKDGDMSEFMRWLTTTHVRQRRVATQSVGHGHLYQGTYKSFPIEKDKHLHDVIRYVEQNPLRAKLCRRAEQWKWSSLYRRHRAEKEDRELLAALPTTLPSNYLPSVNTLLAEERLMNIHHSIRKGAPYGSPKWTERMVERYHMEGTQRGLGRPKEN